MPNLPISQLPQSTALQGDELFVDVQGGVTKYTTLNNIAAFTTSSIQTEVNNLTAATSSYITGVDLSNYAIISGGNDFIGDQQITGSLFISGGVELGGDIYPQTPQGATLGTIDKPFRDLFLQSGSISIESDTPGDPSAIISNVSGNLEISIGGMLLVESGSSFTAPTGSFDQLSAGLQEGYMWVGDSSNKNTPIPTGSFVQTSQTGSFVQSAYISCYNSSSIDLATSGSEQVIPFTSIWTENGISLVNNNRFVFAEAGVYKFELLTTLHNDQTTEYDAWFWIKYNGGNFPNSTTKVTVQKQKGSGEHAHELVAISILGVAQNPNDYIQIYWTGENTNLAMVAENGNGVYPSSPSVSLNIIRVG